MTALAFALRWPWAGGFRVSPPTMVGSLGPHMRLTLAWGICWLSQTSLLVAPDLGIR